MRSRFRAPDVQHVSVVGLPCGEITLFHILGRRALLDPRPEVVAARFRAGLATLVRAMLPDVLYVGGGLSERPEVRAAIAASPAAADVVWSGGGRFVGELGGRQIAGASAIICDVGQTAIKVSRPDGRRIHERPPQESAPDGCDLAGIAFIRDVLASALSGAPATAPLVLALPGDLSDDLTPGPCSYRWGGRSGLVDELLPRRDGRPVLVLNDAELAAESARVEVDPSRGRVCLVLTLGYAPGAALLTRAARAVDRERAAGPTLAPTARSTARSTEG